MIRAATLPSLYRRLQALTIGADRLAGLCGAAQPGSTHLAHRPRVIPRHAEFGARRAFAAAVAFSCAVLCAAPAHADPFRWPQPGGPGTPVVLTYSFSNLLDQQFLADLNIADIRASTAEAFGLWSRYSPLNFVERPDSGPAPSDWQYAPDGHPDIRIGHHLIGDDDVLAHAYLPSDTAVSGLAGDIHFNSMMPRAWSVGGGFPAIGFLEVITHEIGHSLGLNHILFADAIMQPGHAFRFRGAGTGYLLPPDIDALRTLYGSGVGSVQPMPEPSTILLLAAGLGVLAIRRGRRTDTRR
jgi:hypothetical protein